MNFVMEQFAIKLKKASKCGDSSARGSRWEWGWGNTGVGAWVWWEGHAYRGMVVTWVSKSRGWKDIHVEGHTSVWWKLLSRNRMS
jgi:hypothetical protein